MNNGLHRFISTLILLGFLIVCFPVSAQTDTSENFGGEVEMVVDGDIRVDNTEMIALEIIGGLKTEKDSAKKSEPGVNEVNIEITGDLTSVGKGFLFDIPEESDAVAKVLVTGTLSGKERSVEISEYVRPENLDLAVWKIEKNNGHASENPEGGVSEFEGNIKYLI